jgi:hypothetical protein
MVETLDWVPYGKACFAEGRPRGPSRGCPDEATRQTNLEWSPVGANRGDPIARSAKLPKTGMSRSFESERLCP